MIPSLNIVVIYSYAQKYIQGKGSVLMMQLKVGSDEEWYCIYLELWRYDVIGKILNILMLLYYTNTALSYDFVTLNKYIIISTD